MNDSQPDARDAHDENDEDEYLPPLYDETSSYRWGLPVAILAVLLVAVYAGLTWLEPGDPASGSISAPVELPELDGTTRDYIRSIEVLPQPPARWVNMLGQEIVYLDGTVINRGERPVRALELTFSFFNLKGEVVRRDTFRPVGSVTASHGTGWRDPLVPAESRNFRVAFENLPRSWNQHPPPITVTGLLLEDRPPPPNPSGRALRVNP